MFRNILKRFGYKEYVVELRYTYTAEWDFLDTKSAVLARNPVSAIRQALYVDEKCCVAVLGWNQITAKTVPN